MTMKLKRFGIMLVVGNAVIQQLATSYRLCSIHQSNRTQANMPIKKIDECYSYLCTPCELIIRKQPWLGTRGWR